MIVMTLVFDSKAAGYEEIDHRLGTLSAAVRAFVDHWVPRVQSLHAMKAKVLAAFDAQIEDAHSHTKRVVIAAHYEALLNEIEQEGKSHRHVLDRLINFYTNEDVDLEELTFH